MWKNSTLLRIIFFFFQEAFCKSLLVADVAIFFVVGETIGRRCWGSYPVKGAYGDTALYTEEDIKRMDAERAKAASN